MRKSLLPLVAAAGLVLAPVALAQDRNQSHSGQPSTLTEVNLEFKGGTMDEFVGALRAASDGPVNVVLQGQANKIHVDAMKLQSVTVASAVRAALEPRIGVTELNRDGTASTIMLTTVQPDNQGQPVMIVGLRADPAATTRLGGGQLTEVLSIQRLVQGGEGAPAMPEQVVLSAIDSGLKLTHAEEDAQPEITYHKDSGLLLVRGSPGDVQVVKSVVIQLSEDHRRRGLDAIQRKRIAIQHQAEIQKVQVKMGLAERRVDAAGQRLGEVSKLVESGNVSRTELADATMNMEEARAQVQLLKIEMQQLAQEAELAEPPEPSEPPKVPTEKPKAPAGGRAK